MEPLRCYRRVLPILLATVLLWPAPPAAAQRVIKDAASDLEHGLKDVLHVWTAPAHMRTSDLEGLAVVFGVGGLLLLADGRLQEWVDGHPSSAPVEALQPFREDEALERVGDIWYTFRYGAAAWLLGLAFDSETVREAAMGCLAAGVAQTVPRRVVFYGSIARTRPQYTDDPWDFDVPGAKEWARQSLPGGHAANAVTCISFLAEHYSLGALEPVLYAAAAAAALARVPDGAHWASDSWFGLALGYAVGRAVAARSRGRTRSADQAAPRGTPPPVPAPLLSSRPHTAGLTIGVGPHGLKLGYTHRF
jgi:hypothetical protein